MAAAAPDPEWMRSRAQYPFLSDDQSIEARLGLALKCLRAELTQIMPDARPPFIFLDALEVAIRDEIHQDRRGLP